MKKNILIIQAHPDDKDWHYCYALSEAYEQAAKEADYDVQTIYLNSLGVKFLTSKKEWESTERPPFVEKSQRMIDQADHLVFIYPLWLGTMPALLKAWLEQVLRPDFAFSIGPSGGGWTPRLRGKSAHIVVTMGMPTFFYRWIYFAHSLKNFERNILKFAGVRPVKQTLIGMVDSKNDSGRKKALKRMKKCGRLGL